MTLRKRWMAIGLLCLAVAASAQESETAPSPQLALPPLEIFLIESMQLEHLAIWIPADKTGPTINRSCRTRTHCQYTCTLPAHVEHSKSDDCPAPAARLLADFVAPAHQNRLPLTIFNGWQWEYRYSLSQFETAYYDLRYHGGSWENCLEAVVHQTTGSLSGKWYRLQADHMIDTSDANWQSVIDIISYSAIRTRHGYPKKRILDQ